MGPLALADSKTLKVLPGVIISCSAHIRGCRANVQSHVWACSKSTEKGTCTFSELEAESLWNWDKVGTRTWRWGQPSSTAFYQWWELRQDEVTSLLPRKQSGFGGSDTKCNFLWRTCLACMPLVFGFFFSHVWNTLENILLSEEKSSWILENCNKKSWKWKGRYLTDNMWGVSYLMGCSISWTYSATLCCWPYHSNFTSRP